MMRVVKSNKRARFLSLFLWPLSSTIFVLHLLAYRNLNHLAFSEGEVSGPLSRHSSLWSNKYNLVHVVHSRFMQHQGNLTHLGRARLELFKSFCMPTLQQQTTQEFLWILWTDPTLDAGLRSELVKLVRGVPNAVVLAQNSYPEGFRNATLFDSSPLWSGSRQLLIDYRHASQRHTLVETQLDADDGLNTEYLERIQRNVNLTMGGISSESWRVYCIQDYIEWQFFSLPKSNQGLLTPFNENHCPTPGLTWVYSTGAGPHNRSISHPTQHFDIHELTPECSEEPKNCLQAIRATGNISYWAIRARTPTSHGTHQLLVPNLTRHRSDELAMYQQKQEELWRNVVSMFGVRASDVHQSRQKIRADLKYVLLDAQKGRCTQDNSCKIATEHFLHALLEHIESNNEIT